MTVERKWGQSPIIRKTVKGMAWVLGRIIGDCPHFRVASLLALFLLGPLASAQGTANGEWREYGGDLAATKYSPLDQITAENFSSLKIAWRWKSVDGFLSKTEGGGEWWGPSDTIFKELQAEKEDRWRDQNPPRLASLKATPLMVKGVIYLCTPLYQAAAIDAATGQTLWVYNPKSYEAGTPAMSLMWNHRGVAYWEDGGEARIFWGTGDGYLIAVDAKTGRPCADFGEGGRVDLTIGIPRATRGEKDELGALLYSQSSPPIVCRDTVITGSCISDRRNALSTPPGDVRAWDPRTGALKWTFHTIPHPGEFGNETWEDGSWEYTGSANVWTQFSADEELGYVYLPLSTPTNDFYGGHRLGDNLFAESLVCLNAETGERVWHYQTVHHGIWDYDLPCPPNLIDITVNGKLIKAAAQVTKQGFTFVFDRVTGEPVFPIEERPVAASDVPGERTAPTQPHPTKPAPFAPQGASVDDLIDFTPDLRAKAIEAMKSYRMGPLFTPPSLQVQGGTQGTIQRPSLGGAANWTGSAVDPDTGMLYVPWSDSFHIVFFYQPDPKLGGVVRYTHGGRGAYPKGPEGLPLFKPPYSGMAAINLNSGELKWNVPMGTGSPTVKKHPLLKDLNLPPLGGDEGRGPVLTKTLLICAISGHGIEGEPGANPALVAYDKVTGNVVGSVEIPAATMGTPMTYLHDGKQYIGVTIQGSPPEMIALTLPRT